MNKNFQFSVPSSFEEVKCPDFDSRSDVFDWVIYQQKELLLLLKWHLNHKVRTRVFARYFRETSCHIAGTLILSKSMPREKSDSEKISEIHTLHVQLEESCKEIEKCEMI